MAGRPENNTFFTSTSRVLQKTLFFVSAITVGATAAARAAATAVPGLGAWKTYRSMLPPSGNSGKQYSCCSSGGHDGLVGPSSSGRTDNRPPLMICPKRDKYDICAARRPHITFLTWD